MRHPIRTIVAPLLLVLAAGVAAAFPPPVKPLDDYAKVIDDSTAATLRTMLADVERDTTAEIAVVTVTSLEGTTVEDYAAGLFKEWGIGKKGADNGVLVLVCPTEHRMRIEVGYGLEPVLPDGLAGELIRNEFTPRFKQNDYAGGILHGVERVVAVVRAKHVLTPEERKRFEQDNRPPTLLMTPFLGLFIAIGAFMLGAGLRTKAFFPILFGSVFGGVPFIMAVIPFFNVALWVIGLVGIGMFVWGFRKGASPDFAANMRGMSSGRTSSGDSSSDSGWVMGGSSSSSSSDSDSSSSSSFGGGESGGGGASGSW